MGTSDVSKFVTGDEVTVKWSPILPFTAQSRTEGSMFRPDTHGVIITGMAPDGWFKLQEKAGNKNVTGGKTQWREGWFYKPEVQPLSTG